MSEASPNSARIGRWLISSVPASWFFIPSFGLRHNSPYPTSNITVKDDVLLAGNRLEPYIQAQITILRRTYLDPAFAGPQSAALLKVDVDETMLLLIRHQPVNGTRVMQVQTYVRLQSWIGIITLTTVEQSVRQVRPDYERFIASLAIAPDDPPNDPDAAPAAGNT